MPGVLLARTQPAGRVMAIICPDCAPVTGVQVPVNPVPKVTLGDAETVNEGLNVTVMVLPAASAPLAEGAKPTAQGESALGNEEPGEKVTPVGVVAVMTTAEPGLAAVTSCEVARLKVLARYDPFPGLVIPAMVTVAAVLLASAQLPVRVMVTT